MQFRNGRQVEALKDGKRRYGNDSAESEREAYERDGGDAKHFEHAVMNPGKVDEGLWEKAKRASKDAFGEERWPFITWWYKKQGGHFG